MADTVGAMALMTHSAWHRDWLPADVLNWIVPPILLDQYVLLRSHHKVVGFASWAFVDDTAHSALLTHSRALGFGEWRGGEHIWIVDFMAPFGHVRLLSRLLRKAFVAAGLEGKVCHRTRRYAPPPTET